LQYICLSGCTDSANRMKRMREEVMQDQQPIQRYSTSAGTHLSQERGDFDFEGNERLTGSNLRERRVLNPTAGNAEQDNSDNSQGESSGQRQHCSSACTWK